MEGYTTKTQPELDLTAHRLQILAQIPKFSEEILRKFSEGSNYALKGMGHDMFFTLRC